MQNIYKFAIYITESYSSSIFVTLDNSFVRSLRDVQIAA